MHSMKTITHARTQKNTLQVSDYCANRVYHNKNLVYLTRHVPQSDGLVITGCHKHFSLWVTG